MASNDPVGDVERFLKARRFSLASRCTFNPSLDAVVVEVPLRVVGTKVGSGITSRRQMAMLQRAGAADGLAIEFLLTSVDRDDLESGLRFLLRKLFPETPVDCFVSLPKPDLANIWLDAADLPMISDSVVTDIRDYLEALGVLLGELVLLGSVKNIPTKAAILRQLKIDAPAPVDKIREGLGRDGFAVPTEKWLRSKLDLLRKEGFVMWRRDDRYLPTERGIEVIPAVRNRMGSDVIRALALARRRWNDD